jgi:hypothetical protein
MGSSVIVIMMMILMFTAGAHAGSAKQEKDVVLLAKEIESKIVKKKNEAVRVQTDGCQVSIEFTNHNVIFLVPLRGVRIMVSGNSEGVELVNSGMVRKFADRDAEPYERLFLRFEPDVVDQIITRFKQVILACGS